MDLKRDDPGLVELGIDAVDDLGAVHFDDDMVSFGGDDEVVPIAVFGELLCLLLVVAFENASTAFLVEKPPKAFGRVGLRTGDRAVVCACCGTGCRNSPL